MARSEFLEHAVDRLLKIIGCFRAENIRFVRLRILPVSGSSPSSVPTLLLNLRAERSTLFQELHPLTEPRRSRKAAQAIG
jgi:hypothetical protein